MSKITGPDPSVMNAIEKGNKVVFFDMEMGELGKGTPLGRIKLELFVKEVSECTYHCITDQSRLI
jgi:hypothetical protein